MARIYTITCGKHVVTRKRYDAAVLQAKRMAYDAIAGQGGLDTKWGTEFYRELSNWFDRGLSHAGKRHKTCLENTRNFHGAHGLKLTFSNTKV